MIKTNGFVPKSEIEKHLYSSNSVVKAYRLVLENPFVLAVLNSDEAARFYALACHSQRTIPRLYKDFDKKPNNGFLDFLVENHPGLGREKAKRTADCFTDYDMKTIQRGEANPFDYKVRLLRNENNQGYLDNRDSGVIQGDAYFGVVEEQLK